MYVRHCDLYFMVQWFCLISWRLFDVWTSYFGILSQYDTHIWLQNKCRPVTYISWSNYFALYLEDYLIYEYNTLIHYEPMCDFKINVGHCVLYFMVQWFCLISWNLLSGWTSYFGIMSQCDTTFDFKINVGYCDLYFMVQWFCLISRRLFDIWTQYFGIISQYDPMFDPKINVGHCDRHVYFMVQWFCLVCWKLFIGWTSSFGIMSQYDPTFWPQNICRSLWPIFHGPLNFMYYLEDCLMYEHYTLW